MADELNTVSLYDEEAADQPKASQHPAVAGVLVETTPSTNRNEETHHHHCMRNTILGLSAIYIAIFAAYVSWIVLAESDNLGFVAIAFYAFIFISIVELILTIICTALTIGKWNKLPNWVKGVGLIPLISSIGIALFFLVAVPPL